MTRPPVPGWMRVRHQGRRCDLLRHYCYTILFIQARLSDFHLLRDVDLHHGTRPEQFPDLCQGLDGRQQPSLQPILSLLDPCHKLLPVACRDEVGMLDLEPADRDPLDEEPFEWGRLGSLQLVFQSLELPDEDLLGDQIRSCQQCQPGLFDPRCETVELPPEGRSSLEELPDGGEDRPISRHASVDEVRQLCLGRHPAIMVIVHRCFLPVGR